MVFRFTTATALPPDYSLQFALDRRLARLQGRFGHGSKKCLYWKQNSYCPVSPSPIILVNLVTELRLEI